jgi:hypothetical protein
VASDNPLTRLVLRLATGDAQDRRNMVADTFRTVVGVALEQLGGTIRSPSHRMHDEDEQEPVDERRPPR